VVVAEASEPVFAAPAVAAVQKWRYQPQLVDGKAVERRGVRTVIRFQPGDRDEP
jgi:outer membrane biosynthesis protein TonB